MSCKECGREIGHKLDCTIGRRHETKNEYGDMADRVRLADRAPQLVPTTAGRQEYVRFGLVEARPAGHRAERYELLGVRGEGAELFLRYCGFRTDQIITGLPLSGPHSNPTPFWCEHSRHQTITLFAPATYLAKVVVKPPAGG